MINQKKIELKCALLGKYLEKTQLMHTVIKAGDFDALESLIGEREELIRAGSGETFPDSPEVIALVRLIAEEDKKVEAAFSRFREDVEKAFNENRKNIQTTKLSKRVDSVYRGAGMNLGGSFDYKK
jgi:hypothetical protein